MTSPPRLTQRSKVLRPTAVRVTVAAGAALSTAEGASITRVVTGVLSP
jgi:hypothetical protein